MIKPLKWNLENIILEASKYSNRKDFRTNSESVYKSYVSENEPYGFFPKFSDSTEFRLIKDVEVYL